MASVIQVSQVYYPESDGKPMGETDEHREEMVRHVRILQDYYRGQQVYVSGNLLVYYQQGDPRKFVVPDAFVVKGVVPKHRRTYKIWVERKAPDVIIETTSRKTRRKDAKDKPVIYARLGVKEYFLFDPDHEYLDPPLQGYRLTDGGYVRVPPDPVGGLVSQELGLRLCEEEGVVQFYLPDTGERLLSRDERADREAERADREAEARHREVELREREAEAHQREVEARQAAEAELARLREELARRPPA